MEVDQSGVFGQGLETLRASARFVAAEFRRAQVGDSLADHHLVAAGQEGNKFCG